MSVSEPFLRNTFVASLILMTFHVLFIQDASLKLRKRISAYAEYWLDIIQATVTDLQGMI